MESLLACPQRLSGSPVRVLHPGSLTPAGIPLTPAGRGKARRQARDLVGHSAAVS